MLIKSLLVLGLLLFFILPLRANEQEILKGVVLERISHFIHFEKEDDKFLVCTYQDEELYNNLSLLYVQRELNSAPIEVENIDVLHYDEIKKCNLFYSKQGIDIGANEYVNTLFVTEDLRALNKGYMIALFFKNSKIHFVINHQAIVDSQLKVDYRLLKAASQVINRVKI